MLKLSGRGVELATELIGASQAGSPVVLVMGATASMMGWPEDFGSGLALTGHPVVRYDHRDTGQSTAYPPGEPAYTVADLAEDLITVIDGHRLRAAHLVGMSLGGLLAQAAALQHPSRVLSLTLIGAQPLGGAVKDLPEMDARFTDHFARLESLQWSNRAAVLDFMVNTARLSAGTGRPFDEQEARARSRRELEHARDMRCAYNHAQIAEGWTRPLDLRHVTQPTLVIHGSEDPIAPLAHGEAIAHQIPGAELLVLQGSGHELQAPDIPKIVDRIAKLIARADHASESQER